MPWPSPSSFAFAFALVLHLVHDLGEHEREVVEVRHGRFLAAGGLRRLALGEGHGGGFHLAQRLARGALHEGRELGHAARERLERVGDGGEAGREVDLLLGDGAQRGAVAADGAAFGGEALLLFAEREHVVERAAERGEVGFLLAGLHLGGGLLELLRHLFEVVGRLLLLLAGLLHLALLHLLAGLLHLLRDLLALLGGLVHLLLLGGAAELVHLLLQLFEFLLQRLGLLARGLLLFGQALAVGGLFFGGFVRAGLVFGGLLALLGEGVLLLGEGLGALGGLFQFLRELDALEQLDGALQALAVRFLRELEVFHRLHHAFGVHLLHGLLELLQRLLELGALDLFHDALQLLVELARLGAHEVGLLHLVEHVLHLLRQALGLLLEALGLLLQAFELAAVFPVGLLVAAELVAQLLELVAELVGLLAHLAHLLGGGLFGAVHLFEALGERGQAEHVHRRAGALVAAVAVVVAHLDLVLDGVAGHEVQALFAESAAQHPVVEHLLVELAGVAEWEGDGLGLVHRAAKAAFGEAPVEREAREAEVVGDAELDGGEEALVELGVAGGGEGDLRRLVAEQAEAVADGLRVFDAVGRAQAHAPGAAAREHKAAGRRAASAFQGHHHGVGAGGLYDEVRAGRRLAAERHVGFYKGAGKGRHVAHAGVEAARRQAGVGRRAERELDAPHLGPRHHGRRVPRARHGTGHHAVAQRLAHVRESCGRRGRRRRGAPARRRSGLRRRARSRRRRRAESRCRRGGR